MLPFNFLAVMFSSLLPPDLPKYSADENPSMKQGFTHLQKQRAGRDNDLCQ